MFVYDKNKDTPFCIGSIGVTSLAGVGGGIKHMTRSTKHLDISGTYSTLQICSETKKSNSILSLVSGSTVSCKKCSCVIITKVERHRAPTVTLLKGSLC